MGVLAWLGCHHSNAGGGGSDLGVGASDLGPFGPVGSADLAGCATANSCGTCGNVCAPGQQCINNTCSCPPYQAFCGGHCIPVAADPANCGACNNACTGSTVCSGGQCTAHCLPGLMPCNHACIDPTSDNQNCGGCNMPCGPKDGCVDRSCVPAVQLGTPPAMCANGGPPIQVPVPGQSACAGNLAQTTFTWALCSCQDVMLSSEFSTDAFDSTKGPYMSGGLGGGVGIDGKLQISSLVDVGGTLWTHGNLSTSSATTVRQDLHVGGTASAQMSVSDDAYDVGAMSGTIAIGKTLHLDKATAAPPKSVTYQTLDQTSSVSVPAPCDCSAPIPVAQIVAARASSNDNASIGLDKDVLAQPGNPTRLDLPCGSYYLSTITTSNPVTIVAHGNTALYIGGDIKPSSALTMTLDPGASFDIFVGGTIDSSDTLNIGSRNVPASTRVYVASPGMMSKLSFSSSVSLAANLYDANATVSWSAAVEVYGAVFAGDFEASDSVKIHYDREVIQAGTTCPSSAPPPPGTPQCNSCTDCNNQACVNGSCGACTSDGQCCAPLRCLNGRCDLPIS
jgi:hypothetical protein